MDKVDLKKELKRLYSPPQKEFTVVDVPVMNFLMVDGEGDPNSAPVYREAVEALYALSYTLKFMSKQALSRDYVVMPLEGLWWVDEMGRFSVERKDEWQWTVMIMQPEWITRSMVERAVEETRRKKTPAALDRVRFEPYDEGTSVQILHVGSYDDEAPTLYRMHHQFIPENGYTMTGKHHEIYLNDPKRTAPDRLRIVLRQPVRPVAGQND